MTLVDELVILALDRSGRHNLQYAKFGYTLAGAALADLMLHGRIGVEADRLKALNGTPAGHPVLDAALRRVMRAGRPVPAGPIIRAVSKGARAAALAHLVGRGVLRQTRGGLLSRSRYLLPPSKPDPRQQLVARIRAQLQGDGKPAGDGRAAALCAFVAWLRWGRRLLPDLGDRTVNLRLAEIGRGTWGPEAVRQALDAVSVMPRAGY